MRRSISRQLTLGLTAILLLAGLLVVQTSFWLLEHGVRNYSQQRLQVQSRNLLASLIRDEDDQLIVNERHHDAVFLQPFSGHYFVIELEGTRWRSRSLWDFQLLPLPQESFAQGLIPGPLGQQLLLYTGEYRYADSKIRVTVAQDYSPILASFRRAQLMGVALGFVVLLMVLLGQRWLVRKALKPLENARQQLLQLQSGQRARLEQQVPEEMQPLVEQVNRLLVHTEERLKRSRNAVGNLGHALKTPLAVLTSLLARPELQAYPELLASLTEHLQQIEQRISREMARARLSGEALPGAYFDCGQELPSLIQLMSTIHGERLQFSWQAPAQLKLPWERDDMLEMLGNVLDNAGKWARSKVQLQITQQGPNIVIHVDDDGPGIELQRREQVQQRGTRLDEQVQGHGLGLGIVRDIVDALAGTLTLDESPLGGLRVTLCLRLP